MDLISENRIEQRKQKLWPIRKADKRQNQKAVIRRKAKYDMKQSDEKDERIKKRKKDICHQKKGMNRISDRKRYRQTPLGTVDQNECLIKKLR